MREGSVDVERLLGDALLLFGAQVLQRTHVVQAIGELDDDDADVGDHGEEHLADVLGLVVFAVGELDFVEFGDAFDDVCDLFAEAAGDLLRGDVGVFDGVVQKASGDGGGVHLQIGEDLGDFEGMDDVGLAGGAELAFVLFLTEGPGGADEIEVVVRTVCADGGENVLEAGTEVVVEWRSGEGGCGGRCYFGLRGRPIDAWSGGEGGAKAPEGSSREVRCSARAGRSGTDGNVASRPIPLSLGAGSGAPICPPAPGVCAGSGRPGWTMAIVHYTERT